MTQFFNNDRMTSTTYERMSLFKVVIYGFSSQVGGYKYEISDQSNEMIHSGSASTLEEARIEANRFVDSWVSDPIETYYRAIPNNK